MKRDTSEDKAIVNNPNNAHSKGQSDDAVRERLRARREEWATRSEDMARRVRESETLTAADLAVVINTLPE